MTTTTFPTHALKPGDVITIDDQDVTVWDTVRYGRNRLLVISYTDDGEPVEQFAADDQIWSVK